MALRARLTPPRPEQNDWPWHHAKWTSFSASLFMSKERRMEAENYLEGGYGTRLSIEAQKTGWLQLSEIAHIWQPSRLKGIQVSPAYGTPYLVATQVFDSRPVPRKWLSLDHTDNANDRFITPGMILVTRSGSVGRATITHKPHENIIISDDLLRAIPRQPEHWGWIYAYLRSPQAQAMMKVARYGHIIKHLEVHHLNSLPIPRLREELLGEFQIKTSKILELRNHAFETTNEAERLYYSCFPSLSFSESDTSNFEVKSSELFGRRRRLEASCYVPRVQRITAAYQRDALSILPLAEVAERIFVPGRFKHIYGDGGTPYLDSADILEVNPDISKFVLSMSAQEQEKYKVNAGWILIPCSGQVYGIIGHSVLSTDWHVNKLLTNHIMRVCPAQNIRSGYLQCVLGHPLLGRPQLIRFAFGSSVPEIAPEDVATIPIPRLNPSIEGQLADLTEEAARARDEADEIEQLISRQAEELIDQFIAGDVTAFIPVNSVT